MQRLFPSLATVFLACLAVPGNLNAQDAKDYIDRGNAWQDKGEYDKAIADYNQAIRLKPNNADPYYFRGNAWNAKGDYDKAIADFNQALTIDPKLAATCRDLAWLHATCSNDKYRDAKKAIQNASRAYQLNGGKEWSYLATLAAAYAESGDFGKAKEREAKAVAMATTDKSVKDKDKAQARSRLELYKQGKPYREESKK